MSDERNLEFTKFPNEDSTLGLILIFKINRESGFTMIMYDKYIDREGNYYTTFTGGSGTHVRIINYPSGILYEGQILETGGGTYFSSKPYRDKEIGFKKSLERMVQQVKNYARIHHIEFTREEIAQIRNYYREKIEKWRHEK